MRELKIKDPELANLVDEAAGGEPALLRHGENTAVVISLAEWERLSTGAPSWGWLLTHAPLEDGDLPERQEGGWREIDFE